MLIHSLRMKLRAELEAPPGERRFGTGWLSGVAALAASLASLILVISLRFPHLFSMPELAALRDNAVFRPGLHLLLFLAYALALLNLVLRPNKTLGFVALVATMLAGVLGGSRAQALPAETEGVFFGLDFFLVNVVFTGFLFTPLEHLFPRRQGQALFRNEWREDLFYYLVSSMLVQVLTFLSLAPSHLITEHTQWTAFRAAVGSQPWLLQLVEIMFLTDLAQYWLHRAFHRVPALWRFHAVHHSAQSMDWLAGARMHFLEIVCLRGVTAIPMFTLGYEPSALQAYILIVYVYSSFIHANLGWNLDPIGPYLVTPRFHHWHHGVDKEAVDVNFAIHFPLLDRLFGTYHQPKGQWPTGYGIAGHPVPHGYWKQFLYPFRREKAQPEVPPPEP